MCNNSKSAMLLWIFCRILLSVLIVFNTQYRTVLGSVTKFNKDSLLDGNVCINSDRSLEVLSIQSKIPCIQLCDNSPSCTNIFYNTITQGCILCRGTNALEQQNGFIGYYKLVMPDLDGKRFKIYTKENNEFWHFNGAGSQLIVSSQAQPDDSYVRFIFLKQEDGSYKIQSVAKPSYYMYDGYNVANAPYQSLHGRDNKDDDNMRYLITTETIGFYRIQTKASSRYVRLDEDKHVTTKLNIADDRSLFKFVEV